LLKFFLYFSAGKTLSPEAEAEGGSAEGGTHAEVPGGRQQSEKPKLIRLSLQGQVGLGKR
jgi:hypothetical protein